MTSAAHLCFPTAASTHSAGDTQQESQEVLPQVNQTISIFKSYSRKLHGFEEI